MISICSELLFSKRLSQNQVYFQMSETHHIIDDEFNEPEQARKIFIGNLPYEADEGIESLQSLQAFITFYQA